MQIWVVFLPGTGGDSLANLFEQAKNVHTIDDQDKNWRLHRYVNNLPKFFYPRIDKQGRFRKNIVYKKSSFNPLRASYIGHVQAGRHVICASHDIFFNVLDASDCRDILLKDQKLVLIDCKDTHRAYEMCWLKNLGNCSDTIPNIHFWKVDRSRFDCIIDMDDFTADWSNAQPILQDLGLDLPREVYEQWQQIVQSKLLIQTVPRYQTHLAEDGSTNFVKIYDPT